LHPQRNSINHFRRSKIGATTSVNNDKNIVCACPASFTGREGVVEGSPMYVYSHIGVCVLKIIANNSIMEFTLDFPKEIYLIRNEEQIVKIVVAHP